RLSTKTYTQVLGFTVTHCEDRQIYLSSGSDNCTIAGNTVTLGGKYGIAVTNTNNVTVDGNVVSDHLDHGIYLGNASGCEVHANDNGLTANEFDLWVDSGSNTNFAGDYNIFWNSTSQAPVKFITTQYTTVAAYSQATGQDTHSIQANPLFVDPANADFHLQGGSPAIDCANSSIADWPATDAEGGIRRDDPSTANTGV